ncbi:MAG TPA: DUF6518 family protein [Chloroflexaceae bacterium]|nr:DUF6518 family protein [Chloroflexaceae bacterium]
MSRGRKALVASLVGGGLAGVIAKLADESPVANLLGLNDLGTYLGLWVVLTTALAVRSPSRRHAALRAVTFLLAMVTSYYGVTRLLFGFFPITLWLAWAGVALTAAPVFAIVVWPARQTGWPAALGAALPIGLLLWEAYSLRLRLPLHLVQFAADLVAAAALVVLLPTDGRQRVRVLLLAPLVVVAADVGFTRILPYALGLLR